MTQFNNLLKNGYCVKRACGGLTASQLKYIALESIIEDKPDIIIVNAGTNNFTKKRNQTAHEIAFEIVDIVKTCHTEGVENILVSSITCRPRFQRQIDEVNELLKYNAGIYNYVFIDNACIREEHLKRDQTHLNSEGINILSNNF